ncbi:helix-turn-helix domain-containing protein [Mesorhizobium sp. WSM3873]|uniref:GlxA family transcriptional regulator n=1 Tax=Mesorhizobium sp. WSM3873 TaxID=1854056 RepID=UPI000A5F2DF9|nr:helix-turn-helix domain-containing protein [Mesorhizobium sp. WSM3873]
MTPALKTPDRVGLPYLKIGIILCPSFTLTPMASFVDALRLAADKQDQSRQVYFAWDFISAGPLPVRASCGLEMVATGNLENPSAYDCIAVCGGLVRDMDHIQAATFDYLQAADKRGIPIIGLCTGSFVLAQAGLLRHRECALHFDTLGEFAARFQDVSPVTSQNYVIDGNIVTCPGSIVAIEVAAFLIAHYSNAGRAQKALNYLLFKPEEPRIVLRTKPYEEALGAASRLTVEAVKVMETRIDTPCSIEELARSLNTSKARLNRAFLADLRTAPAAFWRRIRLIAARELLASRRRSVTEIAYETGFCDTAHFCSTFKKHFSMTPEQFRRIGKL